MVRTINEGGVSVVVPVYNEASNLRELLPRLAEQSLESDRYEVLIVDNGSTDGSVDVVRNHAGTLEERLTVIHERETRSSYAARNRGIEASQGSILAFTDADCRPSRNWLDNGMKVLTETGADLVAGEISMMLAGEPTVWGRLDSMTYLDQERYVREGGWGATANLFVRRECFEEYGLFDESLRSGGDCEFGRRLAENSANIVFASAASVEHPARSRGYDLLRNRFRTGKGVGQLARRNRLDWNPLHWTELVPRIDPDCWDQSDSLLDGVQLTLAMNLAHYVSLTGRITGFFQG